MLYIPAVSMLMDIFMCSEEVNGTAFFDIDCNSDCWDNIHIAATLVSVFFLMIIIPIGMYIRI